MRTVLLSVAMLVTGVSLGWAQAAPPEDPLSKAALSFAARLEQANKQLSEARAAVAKEKLPMLTAVREIDDKLGAVKTEIARLESLQPNFEETQKSLAKDFDASRKSLSYAATLAQDSLKAFGDALLPGENALYATRIQNIQTQLEAAEVEQNTLATLGTAELLVEHLEKALGGYSAKGKSLTSPSNELVEGTFAFYGPEAFFRAGAAPVAGTVRTREGSGHPIMFPLSTWTPAASEAFFAGRPGAAPLDSSGGKALQLAQTQGSVWEQIDRGGVVAYVIIGVGLLAVALALIKLIELSRLGVDRPQVVEPIFSAMSTGETAQVNAAVATLKPITRGLFQIGFAHLHQRRELIEEHVFSYVLKQRLHFERRLPLLAVIATAAPLLGLLGTVTGMVKTFTLITVFGTGSATKLSSGISEALITTKLGLMVAIPALVAHGFLSQRLHKALSLLDRYSFEFVTAAAEAKEDPDKVESVRP